ncbi:hypothetical protein D3C75_1208370 [compost metagenome]
MSIISNTYQGAITVTPSDTVNLIFKNGTPYGKAVYVGGTGDISALMADGTTAIFKAVPVGTIYIGVQRINATGTTATNLVALY